jgi:hypothetical protein
VSIDWDKLQCRFPHAAPVVGLFQIPAGCLCWLDPIQALCRQHLITAESAGPIEVIVWREGEEPDEFSTLS